MRWEANSFSHWHHWKHLLSFLPSWGTEPGMVQNRLADVTSALEDGKHHLWAYSCVKFTSVVILN